MLSRFFIDRPIFAVVLSIFIVLAGLASIRSLPIAQYPEIAPSVVTVRAVYPGASAQVVETQITRIIEDQLSGIEGVDIIKANNRDCRSSINIACHRP